MTGTNAIWRGTRADEARRGGATTGCASTPVRHIGDRRRRARDSARTIGSARTTVLATPEADGCTVADDGTVSAPTQPSALAVMLSGGSPRPQQICWKFAPRAHASMHSALGALAASDNDTARAIGAAFDLMIDPDDVPGAVGRRDCPGGTVEDWPHLSQSEIAAGSPPCPRPSEGG